MITESILEAEADERACARGAAYSESGAVTDLVVSDETISARVVGGDEYAVQLWNDEGALGHSCTCPVCDDGVFCKHGVAAGLAWLAKQQGAPPARRGRDDLAGVREWLAAAPRETLEELLLQQALDDPALRSRLDAQAARAAAKKGIDIESLKETVGKALSVSGFADGAEARAARQGWRDCGLVDYYGMRRFMGRAQPVMVGGIPKHAGFTVTLECIALTILTKGHKKPDRRLRAARGRGRGRVIFLRAGDI